MAKQKTDLLECKSPLAFRTVRLRSIMGLEFSTMKQLFRYLTTLESKIFTRKPRRDLGRFTADRLNEGNMSDWITETFLVETGPLPLNL